MTKTEKCIVAALTLVLGVLLVAFQDSVIKVAVSALGILLIALGVLDFFNKSGFAALVKVVAGIVTELDADFTEMVRGLNTINDAMCSAHNKESGQTHPMGQLGFLYFKTDSRIRASVL